MVAPYIVSESAVLPATPESAYDTLLTTPLEDILGERAGLMPAITGCSGQEGPWGTVGQTRTVHTADGGRALETLVVAERGADYRYRISDIRGPMRPLVKGIDGRFAIEPAAGGAEVTWSWGMHPTNAVSRLVLPVMGVFWHRWARKMFVRLTEHVTA